MFAEFFRRLVPKRQCASLENTQVMRSVVGVEKLIYKEDLEAAIQVVARKHDNWFVNPQESVVRTYLKDWLRIHLLSLGLPEKEAEEAAQQILPPLAVQVIAYFADYCKSAGLERKLGILTTTCYLAFLNDARCVQIQIPARALRKLRK